MSTSDTDPRILVVDDEPQMRRALAVNLKTRGYRVDLAETGERALELAANHHPDLVILDLGLPGIDGIEVIGGLRGWTEVPIIVVSVRDGERDKIEALDTGADDYLTKPFAIGELLARVRAVLRRNVAGDDAPVVVADDLVVDLANTRVTRDGKPISLTPIEWRLVEELVRHRGKLVTHRQLLQKVWGPSYISETNYLRVHFTNIRRKLEVAPSRPRHFITEPGMGYRFES